MDTRPTLASLPMSPFKNPTVYRLYLDEPVNAMDVHLGFTPLDFLAAAPSPFSPASAASTLPCAQIDTGASVSCTDQLAWLHSYTPYTPSHPCPLRLLPATVGSDAVPHGLGFLHVPADHPPHGYLAVPTFYTPALRTTVIDERDFIRAASLSPSHITSTRLVCRYFNKTFTFRAFHRDDPSLDVVVHGHLRDHKAYTAPLLLPDSPTPVIIPDPKRGALFPLAAQPLPFEAHEPPHAYVPVFALSQATERLLWHQRLGHPSDHYLYHAHKHVTGVPIFKHMDPVLDTCPTCIRAKQTKTAAGPHSTRTATVPFQGLSIDFSFAGTHSANAARAVDFVGFNGETCWVLISDHFTRLKTGTTRISKAAPLDWLGKFLKQHAPPCTSKYVHMDQGGELYRNPRVVALFVEHGYEVFPTGADASHQNGPVERGHLVIANAIRAMLTGANLAIRFWPYAFHHWLRIDNTFPSRDQLLAPLKLAFDKTDDFTAFRTFGCRVWVRPPGRRGAKFRPNSRKGIFLGFLPHTTKNILWFDPETNLVKIATHVRFDEGMNDLPMADIPPNVTHLQRSQHGAALPPESTHVSVSQFDVGSSPFSETFTKTMPVRCRRPDFGLQVSTDDLNNRAFVSALTPKSSASRIFSTPKASSNKLRGAYIIRINGQLMFTAEDVRACLRTLSDAHAATVDITFAPEKRATARTIRRAAQELNLFNPAPAVDSMVHSLCLAHLRSIAAIRFPACSFDSLTLPADVAAHAIFAIRSTATTAAEMALGSSFTRRKLRALDTWPLWMAGEHKQLDQFHALGMFGPPIPRPPNVIVLRPIWQYHIKRDGTRRSRYCCDGSPRAAPVLHHLAETYSSCVDQHVQRLFFALVAFLSYKAFGADAHDAFAHSPPPDVDTYVSLDPAYIEWFLHRFGVHLNPSHVMKIQHALQGHPESGKLWERLITSILLSPSFNFTSTVHDKSIYRGTYNGVPILLLRQIDDFSVATPSEAVAMAFFEQVGKELQLPGESTPPISYLGLVDDFNGVDVHQYDDRVVLSCTKYIDRVLRTHGWETPSPSEDTSVDAPCSPLPTDAIPTLYSSVGPPDDSIDHQRLVDKYGFVYRGLLGELLYAYTTCRPDIGYAVVTLSKFAGSPADFHFAMLKKVAKYLRRTRTWGIHFQRTTFDPSLPSCPFPSPTAPDSSFPSLAPDAQLTCFLDAAHANDLRQRRSTTGYVFLLAGGCVSYKCKTQTTTATSSTEAEFYAAVTAAKQARYLRSILTELGFPQLSPTVLYCDNQSAINMINARIPTERSRHILIQFFAIQDWKENGDIILRFIAGTLNPSDDLTKPLGWVLHSRHARRLMGHYA